MHPHYDTSTQFHRQKSTFCTASLDAVIPLKHVTLASVGAPAVIAGPLFLWSIISLVLLDPTTDGDGAFHAANAGLLVTLPLYVALAALCNGVALALQFFRLLSRRSLLVVAGIFSFTLAGLLTFRSDSPGEWSQAGISFLFFFGSNFIASVVLCFAWWWLASNIIPKRCCTIKNSQYS